MIYTSFMFGFVTVLLGSFPLTYIESTTPRLEIVIVTSLGDSIFLPIRTTAAAAAQMYYYMKYQMH